MRLGLSTAVGRREPLARVPELARAIEDAGFDRLWYVDYQLPMKDAVVAMTLAAQATSLLQIGPGVANPITRHPSVLVNAMNAINELSGGRAIVGLGAGHSAVYGVGERPATLAQMEEATTAIRQLLQGEAVRTAKGDSYAVETATDLPRPTVLVAATHPKMLRLAGRVADGVILMGAADVEMTRWQVDRISEGAAEAGRSRDELDIELWAALGLGDDDGAVRDVKAWATSEARVLSTWRGDLPGDLERFRNEMRRAETEYVMTEHLSVTGPNAELISDELAGRLAIAGSPAECAERMHELLNVGLDGITVTLQSGGRVERLERIANELLPLLRTPV